MTKNIIGLMAGSVNTLLIIISMKCSLNQFLSNNIIIVICIASPFFSCRSYGTKTPNYKSSCELSLGFF